MAATDNDDLAEYTVEIDGIAHTMLLTEDDAKRYDAKPKAKPAKRGRPAKAKADDEPATKAKTPDNKAAAPTANKSRTRR